MRVLHVLHHSVPYQDGYCIRSKHIVDFQRRLGLDVEVLTGPQHEIEVRRPAGVVPEAEPIDGVLYHRTALNAGVLARRARSTPLAREAFMMNALRQSLSRLLQSRPFDVVHAHSPVLCGFPAAVVARQRRVPMVYEVRGFWEDGFTERRWASGERALRYRLSRSLETTVFRRADAVVGISRHILSDIAARGISGSKLHHVPNGVDTQRFTPLSKDVAVLEAHGLGDGPIVGFIGSFYQFEGLRTLLEAMVRVCREVPETRLVLVGGGEEEAVIPRLIDELGLARQVVVTGRVPHARVAAYYSIMDVLVYPRIRNRTTELTTPLKPLEAMAMGKPVVGSDVGGIRELLGDGSVGAVFEAGNSGHLAEQLVALIRDPAHREALAKRGRDYALRERGWDSLILKYRQLYQQLMETGQRAS